MAEIPQGYDARCAGCDSPYTFASAKCLKVNEWQRYCSNICARDHESAQAQALSDPPEVVAAEFARLCEAAERSLADLEYDSWAIKAGDTAKVEESGDA